ncbi:hypothetical protein HDU67_010122 [Dinochytrium kinnereticum]|nr:hypothetical protein HDU67_010122 [Dinochytrium kinnereticum]
MGNSQSSPILCSVPFWSRSASAHHASSLSLAEEGPAHGAVDPVHLDQRPLRGMMASGRVQANGSQSPNGRSSTSSLPRQFFRGTRSSSWFGRGHASPRVDPRLQEPHTVIVPEISIPEPIVETTIADRSNTNEALISEELSPQGKFESPGTSPDRITPCESASTAAEVSTSYEQFNANPTTVHFDGRDASTFPGFLVEDDIPPHCVPNSDTPSETIEEQPLHAGISTFDGEALARDVPTSTIPLELELNDAAPTAGSPNESQPTGNSRLTEEEYAFLENEIFGSDDEDSASGEAELERVPLSEGDRDEGSIRGGLRGGNESPNASDSTEPPSDGQGRTEGTTSNGRDRPVVPDEVLNGIIRLAMLSALRRNMMNAQRSAPPRPDSSEPLGSSDETHTHEGSSPPLNPGQNMGSLGSRPAMMVIGIRTGPPDSESNSTEGVETSTGDRNDTHSSTSRSEGEDSESSGTSQYTTAASPATGDNRRGWLFYIIAGAGPERNEASDNTESSDPSQGRRFNDPIAAPSSNAPPMPSFDSTLFSLLGRSPAARPPPTSDEDAANSSETLAEGSALGNAAPEVPSGTDGISVDNERGWQNSGTGGGHNDAGRRNDAFASFLVNLIARMVRDESGDNRIPNPESGDYEELLRLAEMIGPARARNATREDVVQQLPVVRWYPTEYENEGNLPEKLIAAKTNTMTDNVSSATVEVDEIEPPQKDEGDTVLAGGSVDTLEESLHLGAHDVADIEPGTSTTPDQLGVKDLLASTREKCTICLFPYEEEDELRILRCRHGFHSELAHISRQ